MNKNAVIFLFSLLCSVFFCIDAQDVMPEITMDEVYAIMNDSQLNSNQDIQFLIKHTPSSLLLQKINQMAQCLEHSRSVAELNREIVECIERSKLRNNSITVQLTTKDCVSYKGDINVLMIAEKILLQRMQNDLNKKAIGVSKSNMLKITIGESTITL